MEILYKMNTAIPEVQLLGLYGSVGWSAYTNNPHTLLEALENSLCVISAWDNKELIGLIRAIGDKTTILYIQDILVKPKYQRLGIGTTLMNSALEMYSNVRQIVLMTDDNIETTSFYKKLGLQEPGYYGCVSYVIIT